MKAACCLLISLAIFCSCKKSNGPATPEDSKNVYVSGYCWDSLAGHFVPVYWENNVVHYLAGNGANSYGRAIAWSNNELLIAGQANDWLPQAGLWVNNVPQNLGTGDTSALSDIVGMYVSGGDIYLAGFGVNSGADYGHNTYAKIWKNGTITNLNNSPGYSQAVGVTVVGQDVYIAWTQKKSNNHNMAVYNKNGDRLVLDSVSHDVSCQAICSSGSDVYIAGNIYDSVSQKNLGVYWKNGSPVTLTAANENNTAATAITSYGNDVYIAGMVGLINTGYAVYWKNGTEHRITEGTINAVAYAIAISGSDVYTAGLKDNQPMYWKNDVAYKLSQDKTHMGFWATGIVVVPK